MAVLQRARQENFPVAPVLLPRATRHHLMAIYAFARLVDDIGDEGPLPARARLSRLDWCEAELDRAAAGTATDPVFVNLAVTIDSCHLGLEPLRRLIAANRQDQVVRCYPTFDDLSRYCELSANPVGRLVLQVFGVDTPPRQVLSDDVCTGLQVVEHLQDVGEDAARGRVYLPAADRNHFAVPDSDLVASSASPNLRRLVAFQVDRARGLLASGPPLADSLRGWARLAVAGFAAGGQASLDAIEAARFDVLARPCRPRRSRFVVRLLGVLTRSRRWT